MARQIRHHVAGGGITSPRVGWGGVGSLQDDRDRKHFVELFGEMVQRYGIVLHAYVLMGNHYHLLIETRIGNASRAVRDGALRGLMAVALVVLIVGSLIGQRGNSTQHAGRRLEKTEALRFFCLRGKAPAHHLPTATAGPAAPPYRLRFVYDPVVCPRND